MSKVAPKKSKSKSNEEIFAGFQALRTEQRKLANKISELEMDLNEHKIVIETLKGVDMSRKCFRLIGGVLVERTVADVLPELEMNSERVPKAIQTLHEQLTLKGQEINDYIEKHDIEWNVPPVQLPSLHPSRQANLMCL
ncbi:hypothetical protein ACJJTC_007313 [Scirpophaga incertulas]